MFQKPDLESFRAVGDVPADELITKLVEIEGIGFIRQLMPFLSDYEHLSFKDQPKILQDFLTENAAFPAFYDKKKLIRATDYYRENQQHIGLVLGIYALPYCYLGADGVKVLYLSARIRNDTHKRLLETGAFLKAVMSYDNWNNRRIFAICLKVRLLHAAIRHFTMHSNRWDLAWGYPINQEDMLGTNLAFSLVVLRGMEKLGYQIEESQERAYLNIWDVIGYLLGVKSEILPCSYFEAVHLDKMISKRQFRQSEEGQALTQSLMQVIRSFAPNETTADLLQEQSRFLLGEKYAALLGIKETNVPKTLLKVYNSTSSLMSKFF